jgi:hypothetical protein
VLAVLAKKSPPSIFWVVPPLAMMIVLLALLFYIALFLGETYSGAYTNVLSFVGVLITILGIPSELASSGSDRWLFLGVIVTGAGGCVVSYIFITLRFINAGLVRVGYWVGLIGVGFFTIAFLYLWLRTRTQSSTTNEPST